MLRNRKHVRAHKVLCLLRHADNLLEAVRLHLIRSHNTVRVNHVARGRELHAGEIDSVLDESDSLAGSTNRLEVAKGLADPVHGTPVLAERFDRLCATGDEDAVIHGGSLAFEMVVCYDA